MATYPHAMVRRLFTGGLVFDGTGAAPRPADVVVEDGRFVAVGTVGTVGAVGSGLDGDEVVDVSGRTLLPGLIDCHSHVMLDHLDVWRHVNTPFSYPFYRAIHNLGATLDVGITTVRDAFGADLAGIAVHIGARVGSKAGRGEVWVSSTVKDLVAGSALTFEDAGEHELKGVPDRWHLYRVEAG